MLMVEGKRGLPLAEDIHPGNVQEKSTVEPLIEHRLHGLPKPDNLLGDGNFSSQPLSQRLWSRYHIHFTAPPKRHYVNFFHDGRRLRRMRRRWKVERCIAWLRSHRRIDVRWDIYPEHYLGFIQLVCCMLLLKAAI
jgi:transposase